MPRRSDIWRIGIVSAPIGAVVAAGGWDAEAVRWLDEEPPFAFLADPFGLTRDGELHLFAEAYDYRTRHGVIDLLRFDAGLSLVERTTVLREPWHLSYPFVFEGDGDTWMIPEAHRSGAVTLYRAVGFPRVWEPVVWLELDTPAIDPTVFRHGGLWWMAYSPAGDKAARQGRLHLAYAESLHGPWRTHAANPVRVDVGGSRPGGAPFVSGDLLTIPVQDCARTYGGAIRMLRVHDLAPDRFVSALGRRIEAPASAAPYSDGLHTLSACGDLTLVDVKRIDRSLGGLAIEIGSRLRRRRA